jgi:hypothetical protein
MRQRDLTSTLNIYETKAGPPIQNVLHFLVLLCAKVVPSVISIPRLTVTIVHASPADLARLFANLALYRSAICTLYMTSSVQCYGICVGEYVCRCVHMYVCWLLPSNQSFYTRIAGYRRGVGDHRVG